MSAARKTPGHTPVMVSEVVAALAPKAGEVFVDGTFGGGGYSLALLDAADCRVFGIDRDPEAIARGRALEARFKGRLTLIAGRFSEMDALVEKAGGDKVDGVALDLGVSSFQLDDPNRGFSFQAEGPLDMRMGAGALSAADVVNTFSEKDLADIFFTYGEEKKSRRIAKKIVTARAEKPIATTTELSRLVCAALGAKKSKGASALHPATRVFQALRIFVNRELDELEAGLKAAEQILREGGRLAVVSFHSLEDRIVKHFMKQRSGNIPQGSRHSPPEATPGKWREPTLFLPQKKAELPAKAEVAGNPRARSARLRVAIRTAAPSGAGA